jgi:hypothetical protein
MHKRKGYLLLLLILILSGCSAKLSAKKSTFDAQGITYNFQLPSTWQKIADFKVKYNNEAVFGAEDTKSNSKLLVMATRKQSIAEDFGKQMRAELKKQYNYKKAADIFMKEFKVGDYKGYMYVLDTYFDKRETWLQLYYIETAHGLVQLNYYSAKDGDYQKRSTIIDQSAQSVKEKQDVGTSETEEESIIFENETLSLQLTGVMQLEGKKEPLLALRYTLTNKSTKPINAAAWDQWLKVTQNNKVLKPGLLAKDNTNLDIPQLIKQKEGQLAGKSSIESVSLYELNDADIIVVTPDEAAFPTADEVSLVVPQKGDN